MLDWNDNTEGDLSGYHVHRSTAAGGPYTKITVTLVTTSTFTDVNLTNGVTFFYLVTAVDIAGNESGFSVGASATPASVDPNLVGHWKLDEGNSTIAADSSGQGVDGTLINGPTWATGKFGGALSFDGVDDYVETGYTTDLPKWTVSVWVRSPAAPSAVAASGPVHREKNLQITWDHPNPTFRGVAGLRAGGAWYAASFGILEANTWYHLAATYDGENLKAYKDGVLITNNTSPSGDPDPEIESLKFGRHAGAAQHFNGTTDEIRIYNRALSDAEIASIP